MEQFKTELTEEEWNKISRFLPELPKGKGGPKPISNRLCFEGILWVLRSGTRWKDLPSQYPSPSTCWRRLQYWEKQGAWLKALSEVFSDKRNNGIKNLEHTVKERCNEEKDEFEGKSESNEVGDTLSAKSPREKIV